MASGKGGSARAFVVVWDGMQLVSKKKPRTKGPSGSLYGVCIVAPESDGTRPEGS